MEDVKSNKALRMAEIPVAPGRLHLSAATYQSSPRHSVPQSAIVLLPPLTPSFYMNLKRALWGTLPLPPPYKTQRPDPPSGHDTS